MLVQNFNGFWLGKQRDHLDTRAAGILHLIKMLEELSDPPLYIFLENVPGFETSECHRLLLEVLSKREYVVEEYMVSPTDPAVGIPNRRRRYYLSAKLQSVNQGPKFIEGELLTTFKQIGFPDNPIKRSFTEYYNELNDVEPLYQVPLEYIRSAKDYRYDIVNPRKSDSSCSTFTKAYGTKYVIGSGSFIQTKGFEIGSYQTDDQEILPKLGLRFFSPMEIADLHAFPIRDPNKNESTGENKDTVLFKFPDDLTLVQKYALLGNSLNVRVVALLLSRLFNRSESQ